MALAPIPSPVDASPVSSAPAPARVYLAGTLFNVREVSGNVELAEAIEAAAAATEGRAIRCVLPQELPFPAQPSPVDIRNTDIAAVLGADALVLQFDGLELDSGTVAEFMLAKAADIPCVLLRTDIRAGGDQSGPDAEPWNLMLSGWPRTRTVLVPSLLMWVASAGTGTRAERLAALYAETARRTVEALRDVLCRPPLLRGEEAATVRAWVARMSVDTAASSPGGRARQAD
ncbi:hypothetical protein DB346_00345 [Verrucomicrobia bacterium LW23]|nr:hypothetical protein DB346_00345 [Verrucomicrobia bacterium LW23]